MHNQIVAGLLVLVAIAILFLALVLHIVHRLKAPEVAAMLILSGLLIGSSYFFMATK